MAWHQSIHANFWMMKPVLTDSISSSVSMHLPFSFNVATSFNTLVWMIIRLLGFFKNYSLWSKISVNTLSTKSNFLSLAQFKLKDAEMTSPCFHTHRTYSTRFPQASVSPRLRSAVHVFKSPRHFQFHFRHYLTFHCFAALSFLLANSLFQLFIPVKWRVGFITGW